MPSLKKLLHYKACYKGILTIMLVFFSVLSIPTSVNATINEAFTFQGKIVATNGTNLTNGTPSCVSSGGADTCDFRIRLYDASSSGNNLWEEVKSNIELYDNDGIFNLLLDGSTCSGSNFDGCFQSTYDDTIFSNGTAVYIQVEFDPSGNGDFTEGETFTPRRRMTAVPYAFNAKYADTASNAGTLDSLDSADFLRATASDTYEGVHSRTLTVQSSLASGARATDLLTITQANDGSNNFTGDLVSIEQQDTGSAGNAFFVNNEGTGYGIRVDDESADTTPFIVDASGQVGIGTTTASAALDVVGDAEISGGVSVGFVGDGQDDRLYIGDAAFFADFGNIVASSPLINFDTNDYLEYNRTSNRFSFFVGSGEEVRVDASALHSNVIRDLSGGDVLLQDDAGEVGIGVASADYKLDVVSSDTTGVLQLTGNSITTGVGFELDFNGLTTGIGLDLSSTSTTLSSGNLASFDWSPASSTTASGDLVSINIGANGNIGTLFNVKSAGSTIFSVSESGITSAVPHTFTSAGDVEFAYDVYFSNSTAAYINFEGPGYIRTFHPTGNYDLTLSAANSGVIRLDDSVALTASQYLNWGTTTGSSGYGIRDNAGTMQFKNSGGAWTDLGAGGGGGTPGGSDTQLQYNNGGAFGGVSVITWDDSTLATTISDDLDLTLAGSENLTITSDLAGSVNALSIVGTPSGSAGTAYGVYISQADSANSNGLDAALVIENLDTNLAVADGILVASAAGLITDGLDVSDAEIDNGVNLGGNFLLADGIRLFASSSTVWTIEDTENNDLLTLTDAGSTGNMQLNGNLTIASTTPLLTLNETDAQSWQFKVDTDQFIIQRAGSDRYVVNSSGDTIIKGTFHNNEDTTVTMGASAASSVLNLQAGGATALSLAHTTGNATVTGDLAVNGDDITGDATLTLSAVGYTRVGDTATPGTATADDDLFLEGDFEMDGGQITLDNATDLDIDDNTSSALTISEGSNNYLLITTTNGAPVVTLDTVENGGILNLGSGNFTRTLNVGTGTGADTINIGTGATNADALTFGNTGVATTFDFNTGAATTDAFDFALNGVTTARGLDLSLNGLTTGSGIYLSSTTTSSSFSGSLLNLNWLPSSTATASGDLIRFDSNSSATITGSIMNLLHNGSSIFKVATAKISSNVPHEFTAAGDVSVAYDLVMSNQTSSKIESYGPLTIEAGESFENNDLTLKAFGTGRVLVAGSGLGLETGEKLIFDTNDSGDSYMSHNNGSNYTSIFTDNLEVARFMSDGSVDGNTTFDANQFDIAEYYPSLDESIEAGDVVSYVDSESNEGDVSPYLIERTQSDDASTMLGVVSTKPGFSLGGGSFRSEFCSLVTTQGDAIATEQSIKKDLTAMLINGEIPELKDTIAAAKDQESFIKVQTEKIYSEYIAGRFEIDESVLATIQDKIETCKAVKQVPVALAGRVPVKVDLTNGEIHAGDWLTVSAATPGSAMKATAVGMVIGRALESFTQADIDAGKNTLMLFVNSLWYPGENGSDFAGSVQPLTLSKDYANLNAQDLKVRNSMTVLGRTTLGETTITGDLAVGLLDFVDNSINATGTTLKIQDQYGAGNVDIFKGKIVMTTTGDIKTQAVITAAKVDTDELIVSNNESLGKSVLTAGTTKVTIPSSKVKGNSKIFVTPKRPVAMAVTTIQAGQNFVVEIEAAKGFDIEFDWFIVQESQ